MAKNVIAPYHLVDAQSMASDITSAAINVQYLDNVGLEVVWTGAPTGTFSVEASISGTTYVPLNFTSDPLTAATGSAGSQLINLFNIPFKFYRIKYTRTSGSGTLDVWTTVKEE